MRKHPQIAKKNGSKSEKYKFKNILTGFFQREQVLLKGFQQNSMNQKAKVTFCLEMVMIPLENEKILIPSSHYSGPIVHWLQMFGQWLILSTIAAFTNVNVTFWFMHLMKIMRLMKRSRIERWYVRSRKECQRLKDQRSNIESSSVSSSSWK